MNSKLHAILQLVAAERERQQRLHGARSCAGHELLNAEKLVVLAEKFGEVAEALSRPGRLSTKWREHLREELIQTAAMSVAWAESLTPKVEQKQTKQADTSFPLLPPVPTNHDLEAEMEAPCPR